MRCLTCQNLSFKIICPKCQKNLLRPNFNKRELQKDFFVYSFYGYEEVKELISSKYEFYGDKVFNLLAGLTFKKFASDFEFDGIITALPVDDHTRHHFSQTAVLAKALRSQNIKPKYGTLRAANIVKYAGRDLEFRKKNPRNFSYTGLKDLQVILVDDLVTTGTTILEAKRVLEEYGCEVLFALTLSDAKF
jgi:competence protein ComFC